MKPFLTMIVGGCVIAAASSRCDAQRLEPRRWAHLPMGVNVAGGGYSYTNGEVFFDPVLRLENVEFDLHAAAFKYVRTFELFEKSARIDLLQGYADAKWTGLLDGVPDSTRFTGLTDTNLRFAMQLFGAPPLKGKEFADYRAAVAPCETIVGVGLTVQLPTGGYEGPRLLNLGTNRYTFRPRVGVVHSRGNWTMELNATAWFFTDDDDFLGRSKLETDPHYALEGHLVYTFRPGVWLSAGLGYGFGSESTLDGVKLGDKRGNLAYGVSLGFPINREWSVNVTYIGVRAQEPVGSDSDTVAVGISVVW